VCGSVSARYTPCSWMSQSFLASWILQELYLAHKHVMLQWHSYNCGRPLNLYPVLQVWLGWKWAGSLWQVSQQEVTKYIHQLKEGPCIYEFYCSTTLFFFFMSVALGGYLWVRHWIRFRGLWVWPLSRLFPGMLNLSLLLVIKLWEYRCALHHPPRQSLL